MKKTKAKGPKRVSPPKAARPPAETQPVIDPALLEDIMGVVDEPEE